MRLRNVKGAEEKINSSSYVILNFSSHKGKYKEIFKNNNKIELEIGIGKGDFIIKKSIENPNINYIGIEKYDSVLVKAIEKLENLQLNNLKLIKTDAITIDEIFEKEIDTLYLNFSDPWPKKKHTKRRLTNERFLKKYDQIFKKTNHIIMKTDNRKLFEYSIISFTDYNYKIKNISLDLHKDNITDNIETEYEKKFSALGEKIYMIEVYK